MLADIVKIHCLTHRTNFPMPRTSRVVVCREGGAEHILGNNFPLTGSWMYCCNCQTFIAWDLTRADVTVKECPFCLSSLNLRLYACDHCAVTMMDYDDPTLRKHHTVLAWGMPQPACPACHQFPGTTPRTHFCQVLQANLSTARPSCPFCQINLETTSAGQAPAVAPPLPVAAKSESEAPPELALRLNAALAEAQARAREAEERQRLAEDAIRKEIELRRQAELKAQEIEKRIVQDSARPDGSASEAELARQEAAAAKAQAEAEAQARADAEQRAAAATREREEAERLHAAAEARLRDAENMVRAIEEERLRAEASARREAEMRTHIEQQAREAAALYTSQLAETQAQIDAVSKVSRRDRVTIALMAGIAVALFFALLLIVVTLLQLSQA
jgi:hypothetical protein